MLLFSSQQSTSFRMHVQAMHLARTSIPAMAHHLASVRPALDGHGALGEVPKLGSQQRAGVRGSANLTVDLAPWAADIADQKVFEGVEMAVAHLLALSPERIRAFVELLALLIQHNLLHTRGFACSRASSFGSFKHDFLDVVAHSYKIPLEGD